MTSPLVWIIGTIGLTVLIHFLTIALCPYMIVLLSAIKNKRKPNEIYHQPPTTFNSREVVRPSPDLLYSGCAYHIVQHPLRITAYVPADTYFSISAFAANTDNFFVINDRQIKTQKVDLVLKPKNISYEKKEEEIVVEVPTKRGAVFIRTLVNDPENLKNLIKIQHKAECCLVV